MFLSKTRNLTLLLLSISILCACGQAYERYMQEGQKFRDHEELDKARKSFHYAALDARKNSAAKKERLIDALLAEAECAQMLKQNEDVLSLFEEAVREMEKTGELKRAAGLAKKMGDLNLADSKFSDAMQAYEAASADLKQASLEKSHAQVEILFSIADLKIAKKDNLSAARYLEQGSALMDEINDTDAHAHADALHKLSFIYQEMNRENDAIAVDEQAKALEMGNIRSSVKRIVPKF